MGGGRFILKGTKSIVYMGLTLGMLAFAVPKLEIKGEWTLQTVFGLSWMVFALLVIAAHLHELLGVDEETKREMMKIKRMKRWQMQQALQGRRKLLHLKK